MKRLISGMMIVVLTGLIAACGEQPPKQLPVKPEEKAVQVPASGEVKQPTTENAGHEATPKQ
jgi:predicted small lipoprotein YifL